MVDSRTNYIQNLANDLKEYGKKYSKRNFKYMSLFAKKFSNEEIAQQPAAKIPWRTLVKILYKSNFKYEEFSAQAASQIPWFALVKIIYKSKSHKKMQLNKERI